MFKQSTAQGFIISFTAFFLLSSAFISSNKILAQVCESPATQAYTSTTQTGNQAHRGELGMQFIVNNPGGIIVKQLGAFDDHGDGISGLQPGGSIRVAIFNRSTQTIVPGLDVVVVGVADAYTGNHRMKNITPVNLPPGDYVIVAKGYYSGERNGNSLEGGGPYPPGNTGGGAITFGNETLYGPDDPNGFSYPASTATLADTHVYLAGTFNFTKVIPCDPSANADLSNLVLSQGILTPAFASGTTSYIASVANSVLSITVTPTTAEANATITVNSIAVVSGSASGSIALSAGSNIITTAVTAQDGTTMKTYTVNVTREAPVGTSSGWGLTGNTGTNPTTNFLGTIDAQRLVFKTNNTEKATIDAAGNLGIGTTAPITPLHLFQINENGTGITVQNNGVVDGSHPYLSIAQMGSNGYGYSGWANAAFIEGAASGGIVLGAYDGDVKIQTSRTTRMTVLNSSGNVGIGTSAPSSQFHTTGSVRFQGLTTNNALTNILAADAGGNLSWRDASTLGTGGGNWTLSGTNITNSNSGVVLIGTGNVLTTLPPSDASLKLAVEGSIYAQKVKVTQAGWSDYVFYPQYKLPSLKEVEAFIQKNNHLPDMPSAAEVEKNGLNLGDNQALLLKKIEELTLYLIEINKKVNKLMEENAGLKKKLEAINK